MRSLGGDFKQSLEVVGNVVVAKKLNSLSSILVSGPIPASSARSVIEETLRGAILDGRLPCGMALRQQALAELFGVSRMPVREALRQLEAQALLHVIPHKGAVVAELIDSSAIDTYALRQLLETEALRLSIPRLTEADFHEAQRCIETLEGDIELSEIGRLNRLFHMALYNKAPNRRLLGLVEQGLIEEERFLRFNLSAMDLGKRCQDDHHELLESARKGDIEACVDGLQNHLKRAVDAITQYLNGQATAPQ